jgi:transcriptional regulator with XRE-family HTH domain
MITQDRIASAIRVRMAQRNMSTAELAAAIGMPVGSVRLYVKGKIFDIRRIEQIAKAFGLSGIDEFLAEDWRN